MYRLVLYCLILFLGLGLVLSVLGILPYRFSEISTASAILIGASWVTNKIFAVVLKIPTNLESIFITGLILALIVTPTQELQDLPLLFAIAILASASKFIFAINKKHIFNPAALGVFLTATFFGGSVSWWIGTPAMLPVVLLGGTLIVRKLQRLDLVLTFLLTGSITFLGFNLAAGINPTVATVNLFAYSPILFLAFVMLTEPLTTPPKRVSRLIYGSLVGLLFSPQVHLGAVYSTPELALLIGNIFSYLVSPKGRLILPLKEKNQLAPSIYDFIFACEKRLAFLPGQYLEWTLGHKNPDSRGNRRYFTIASSPSENNIRIGVRFNENSSSFKKALLALGSGGKLIAAQLSGEFTLAKDKDKKLVFIAGGIGVTPFRSMIKYLLDLGEKRDIVLFYSVKNEGDLVYRDIFDRAQRELGIKVVYIITDQKGLLGEDMIRAQVSDYKNRIFYLSGPRSMVEAFQKVLDKMGVNKNQVKVDFFPGYA